MTVPVVDDGDAELTLVDAACPACASDSHRPVYQVRAEPPAPRGPWRYVRCEGCQSFYLRPRPKEPRDLYRSDYHVHDVGRLQSLVTSAMAVLEGHRLSRLLPRSSEDGAAVFEIGCGRGDILVALQRRGLDVAGVEPAAVAVAAAVTRGLAVERGVVDDHRGRSGRFDLVLAAHVIEHVARPLSVLEEMRRLLRAGGVGVIKTPLAGSWDGELFGARSGSFDVPYHLLVPTRAALVRLIEQSGMMLCSLRQDPVPNDWVHGLRRLLGDALGFKIPFIRPWNPLVALPLLPFSAAAALAGAAGRARLIVRKPGP